MNAATASTDPAEFRSGLIYAFLTYTIWGISPLYWALYSGPPVEIVAHRALWAAVALAPFVLIKAPSIAALFSLRRVKWAAIGAVLITANWGAFIWAVTNGYVLEASLGYFMGPLINVALGMIFLGERLRRAQWVAVGLALIGVLIPLVASESLPVIGLFLATSFSFYALVRKKLDVDGKTGLFLEAAMVAPFGLAAAIWFEATGRGTFLEASWQPFLLIFSGTVFTAGVLLLFSLGARRLPLSTLGLMQYIAPTLQFIIGLAQGEAFGADRAAAFLFIWSGLAVYTWDMYLSDRRRRRDRRLAAAGPPG